MKTNFKRIGKQSISIVLAVMMMLSTMLVGTVTSNAAIKNWVLSGSFNNWAEIPFGGADGGSITYDLSAYKGTTVEFRTDAYENNKLNKNSTGNIVVAGTEYQLTWGKPEPMKYTVSSTGTGKVTFTVNSKQKNNYLTVTEGDQPITVTPYYVAGETSLVNGPEAWKAEQENDKMSYDETTEKYSITYDKKAAGTYKFKIIEGSSTWHGYNDFKSVTCTDENCTVSDVDGEYHNIQITTKEESNITITLDSTDSTGKKLTISAEPTTQKYTVAVDKNIKNGTVTPSKTSLAAGETFTVTTTPDNGYELDAITVTTADGKTVEAIDASTHTYTMPASNVTVSATFKVKTDAKYSVTYTAPTGEGVVDSSINPTDTALAEGTNVTVTVTVNDGYTASLAVDRATVTTSTSGNTYTFTFSMPAQNITVAPKVTKAGENTGTLIPNLYLIYTTADDSKPTNFTQHLNLYYDSNNQVYASFNENTSFDTSKTYKFMISTLTGENSFRGTANYNKDNSKVYVTTTDGNSILAGKNAYGYTDNGVYAQYVYGWFSVKGESRDTVSSVKINLGYYKDGKIQESAKDTSYAYTYEVIPTSGVEGMVQVFAKDGTIRANFQKYADMADTVLTAENTTDLTKYAKKDYYDTAYAKVGTKLKITTTIGDDYKGTYFVKAFSINGYSYGIIDASQADTTDGVYTCEYTIPEDFKGNRIEITPIYYYIDDTDTVTFYVEGFDETVQAKWGNTVAVQAWYANGEEKEQFEKAEFNSLTKNALGGYPGQPLVYEGGKYSMQIPKYLNGNKTLTVKGITLNNYFWDDIHKQSFSDQSDKSESNCQTYDYDDFYKLSETADVDNIIFDFRYRTTTDNKPSMDGLTKSTYNPNELEPLKDYSGNIVDIFGNFLSKEWTPEYDSEYLTVISDGYKENENIGTYATEWSVYDHDGKYITTINCSSLIDESKVDSAYQAAYDKLKPYAKLPVKIAYEMSKFAGYHKGTRADGRWYFSQKAQKITANVKIEYGADVNSKFNVDEFEQNSNVGTVTRAQAYFTNADYNGKTTCQGTVDGGNFSVHAQTDANANYYFLGWYLKTSDGGYSLITTEYDTDIPMTNTATYVARFINTPSGTLTLSHTLLDGSAYGKTFIKANIIDSANNVKASIDETSGNLVIPSKYVTYTSTYIIRLTLRTVPYGNDTVEDFYEGYSGNTPNHYNATLTGTGEQTYSVERAISSLFEKIDNTDGSVSYKLKKSNIPFYSNITSNPLEYKITYTYKTRLNGEQSYVIKDKVSGIELEQMWADNVAAGLKDKEQLSKAFITKKAPFVSNFREVITWDMDKATINGYVATVSANTTTVDLNISALTVAGQWTQPAIVKYGELAKSDGDYLYKTGTNDFPEKFNYSGTTEYEFSFWAIFDNIDEAKKYSDAVKAYMLDAPAADMSQRLTALTKLDGYKNLISKSYSKEYNYISYQNYYIVPVYAGRFAKSEINESQASIRFLEYTRNQWTNANGVKGDGSLNVDGSKTDYLYTDFALSFDKDQELIKNNANIKVGVTFEVVAKYKKDFDLKNYATDSDKNSIGNLVKAATANGKVGTYTMDGAERNVYKYEINNSNISVKNRIEYYLRFKNSETSQQNVMKVYSYIYDTVSGKIYLSDPVYMNMYDIGNLTYITSDLANINLGPDATV